MRCDRCSRVFEDGDVVYKIGVKRVKVVGNNAGSTVLDVDVFVCEYCVKVEEGEYR